MSVRSEEIHKLNPRLVESLRDNPAGYDELDSECNDWAEHRPNEKGAMGRKGETHLAHEPGRKSW